MPRTASTPPGNRLIAALSRQDRERLLYHCEPVELRSDEVLGTSGRPIRHVYFPTDSVVSLVVPVPERSRLEAGLVGQEGMLGAPLTLGVAIWPLDAVVQGSGAAWRMPAVPFRRQLGSSAGLHHRLNCYLYVLMRQSAQSAACAHFHVVEARLARWLLMTQDRARSETFDVTQQFLAVMLGVRRVGVTRAAGLLQRRHLIHYRRGRITVRDRDGLKAAACGCYEFDRALYERLLG